MVQLECTTLSQEDVQFIYLTDGMIDVICSMGG